MMPVGLSGGMGVAVGTGATAGPQALKTKASNSANIVVFVFIPLAILLTKLFGVFMFFLPLCC
jgi:hypothetical protein